LENVTNLLLNIETSLRTEETSATDSLQSSSLSEEELSDRDVIEELITNNSNIIDIMRYTET
jgi:hypothetical protein